MEPQHPSSVKQRVNRRDDFAVLKGLRQARRFPAQGLELLEAAHGNGDRRLQVGLFDRFDQIGQGVVSFRTLNEFGIVLGGDEDNGDRLLAVDFHGRVDAVCPLVIRAQS
jgi:hypothetical protein